MRLIKLKDSTYTIVSNKDYNNLLQYKWHLLKGKKDKNWVRCKVESHKEWKTIYYFYGLRN